MGIICSVIRLDSSLLEMMYQSPNGILSYLYGDEEMEEVPVKKPWWRLFFKGKEQSTPVSVFTPEQVTEHNRCYLDKAWGGIHFALTGTNDGGEFPNAFLMQGREIGNIDVGYGPARGFNACEVNKIAQLLSSRSAQDWMDEIDIEAFKAADVYVANGDTSEELFSYFRDYLADLQAFMSETSQHSQSILVYYC